MRKAIQGGVINYQDKLWQASKPPCMIKEEFVSVDMEKISPAFLIVGMGIVLAVLVLVCEKVTKKRKYFNVDYKTHKATGVPFKRNKTNYRIDFLLINRNAFKLMS